VLGVALAASASFAHTDDPKARDVLPPYEGPGYRAALAGPQGPPVGFTAEGMILQAWITLGEFSEFGGINQLSANDCWGYTSPSGREYAIIGLRPGTAWSRSPRREPGAGGGQPVLRGLARRLQDHAYVGAGAAASSVRLRRSTRPSRMWPTSPASAPTRPTPSRSTSRASPYRCGGNVNGLPIYGLNDPRSPLLPVRRAGPIAACGADLSRGPMGRARGRILLLRLQQRLGRPGSTFDVTDEAIQLLARYHYPPPATAIRRGLAFRQYLYLNDERT
jgi:hypothetical protein